MEAKVIGDDEQYRGRSSVWTGLQFDRIQYLTCLIVQDVEMGNQQSVEWIFWTCRDLEWMRGEFRQGLEAEAVCRSPRMNASENTADAVVEGCRG